MSRAAPTQLLETGGEAVVGALVAHDVEVVFCLPGLQLDPVFSALYNSRDVLRVIHTRHEQATGYMADGYARTRGTAACMLVVPGPGVLNAASGLATAYACYSPVICVTADIATTDRGRERGVLHEIPDQVGILRGLTKWTTTVHEVQDISRQMNLAFTKATQSPARPVAVQIPADVLAARGPVNRTARLLGGEPAQIDPEEVVQVAKELGKAKSLVIVAGGGVIRSGAWSQLAEVAELLGAPVIMTRNGRGALSDRHPLAMNSLAARFLVPSADVVLIVGSRFLEPSIAASYQGRDQTILQIDANDEEIGRNCEVSLGICADAKTALAGIRDALPKYMNRRSRVRPELSRCKARVSKLLSSVQPQAAYAQAIRSALPDDGIVVNGMTQIGYWNNMGFPVYKPRTFLTPGYQGTLGFEYATALGARAAARDTPVVAVCGDGGFAYQLGELATGVHHDLRCCTIVFNDGAFGNVRRIQREVYDGRLIASDLTNPDFVALAESFGVEGVRCTGGPEQLSRVLRQFLESDRPCVIEVPVKEMPDVRAV